MALILFLVFSIFLQGAFGEIICEDLPTGLCSFSIASSGKRCLLETNVLNDRIVEYQCKTSEVFVSGMSEYIERDECVSSCGVDRNSVGISSDSLLEPYFIAKLCAPPCYNSCPNIVDLYFNLAVGEGVFLPNLCAAQRSHPHRQMTEVLSSGAASDHQISTSDSSSAYAPMPAQLFAHLSAASPPISA